MDDEVQTRVLETPTPGPPVRVSIPASRQVGEFELVRRLAHGGMATVYLGRQLGAAGFEKVVALKLIHPHLAQEPEFLGMFMDEAKIAARLHHPHVVEILNLGEHEGTHYIVMEFVEGGTLAALSRAHGTRMPVAVVMQILADALDGLTAAHELRDRNGRPYDLVHRDVSPQNLLLSLDGRVKVTDFGIMKAAGRRARTRTGELRGKVAYMSPEHATENRTDPRSDVFALGVIGWELLAGRRLFAGESDAATLKRVIACDVPALPQESLSTIDEEDAAAIRALIERSLERDPDHRYSSARAMLQAVRDVLRSLARTGEGLDPRDELASLMKAHFSDRAEYLRAALRDPAPIRAVPAAAGAAEDVTPNDAGGSVTTTLTRPAPTGARAWAPWIALPIAGAAIAIGVLQYTRGERDVDPTPPAVAPLRQEVHWYVSTDPEGAGIELDGVRHPELTPTEVVVPRGPPITVLLTHEGMRPTKAVLRPMRDDNLFYRLVPEVKAPTSPGEGAGETGAAEIGAAAASKTATTTLRASPKVRTKKKPKVVPTGEGLEPGFKPMPNFGEAGAD